MSAFKAARLFSPYKVHEMKPTTAAVDELTAFPFLIGKLEDLKLELPTYMAAVEDVSTELTYYSGGRITNKHFPIGLLHANKFSL